MPQRLRPSAAFVCTALALTVVVAPFSISSAVAATTDETNPTVGEAGLLDTIENAQPAILDKLSNSSLRARGYVAADAVELPEEPGDPVAVGGNEFSLTTTPELDLGRGETLTSNSVAFVGEDVTQVIADKGGESAAIVTVIDNAGAPTEYAYPSTGTDRIEIGESGGAFFYAGEELVGVALAPWAKDAEGADVPTHYEINGGELVQVVEHRGGGFTYPVVADPWYGESLISQITKYPNEERLAVYGTSWYAAVQWNPAIPTQVADEFMRVVGTTYRTAGNKSQVWCHAFGSGTYKQPWNIEHWRPYYGDANMLATGCNPT